MCIVGDVEAPQWAIFLNIWPDKPVFHRFEEMRKDEGSNNWRDFTRCGREVSSYKPWLPFKHAVRFGRPCRSCFPEGV